MQRKAKELKTEREKAIFQAVKVQLMNLKRMKDTTMRMKPQYQVKKYNLNLQNPTLKLIASIYSLILLGYWFKQSW